MLDLKRNFWACLILLGVTVVVFFPVLRADFLTLDDTEHVLTNPAVQELSWPSARRALSQDINGVFIPLTTISFMVEHHFFGFNPFVYHLDNLLLHGLVVLLVFFLAQRVGLSFGAAVFAALFFAIHPMKVESVAWVSERKDLLYAFFYLISLHAYQSCIQGKAKGWYLLALTSGLLSMFAKPMAISLPLVLCLMHWYSGRQPVSLRFFGDKVPFFACSMLVALMNYFLSAGHHAPDVSSGVLLWIWCFSFYIWKFFWPVFILPFYQDPVPVTQSVWPYVLSMVWICGVGAAWWGLRRHKIVTFALLYYVFSIFFLLRFEHDTGLALVSDRYMYLSGLGFCFLWGVAVQNMRRLNQWLMVPVVAVFVFFGIKSFQQGSIWHNNVTFWQAIYRHYPQDRKVKSFLGNAYFKAGKFNEALDLFEDVVQGFGSSAAFFDRGKTYAAMGDTQKARNDFHRSIAMSLLSQELALGDAPDVPVSRYGEYAFKKYVPVLSGLSGIAAEDAAKLLIQSTDSRSAFDFSAALSYLRKAAELGVPVDPRYTSKLQDIKVN